MTETHLYDFYGEECPPCRHMHPLVEKLEKELKIRINKLEVWHNAENAALMEKYDNGKCGGVPFFVNTKTNKFICGATSYEELRKWARGE